MVVTSVNRFEVQYSAQWINIRLLKSDDRQEFEDEDILAEDEGERSGDNPATTGSRGAAYGGGQELFQSQFQLHTVQQKLNQIVLLQVSTKSTKFITCYIN